MHPLDNPIWHALTGPHAHLATVHGPARRYRSDTALFAGVDTLDAAARGALRELAAGSVLFLARVAATPAELGLEADHSRIGHQYVLDPDVRLDPGPAAEVEVLTGTDVPDMLALVELTKPGPFLPRTIELGHYYGVRDGDRLVAMAGERMRLDDWCEVSAVCTRPEARRRGLAALLVATVVEGIRARGQQPFLNVAAGNDSACALYERLGFRHRADLTFGVLNGSV